MVGVKKLKKRTRLVNPATRPGKKRKNPGQLITLGAMNPQGKTMPVPKKKKNPAAYKAKKNGAKKKRPNPFVVIERKANTGPVKKHKRRKPNPNPFTTGKEMLESGAYALAGLVATRQLPQLVLAAKNTGWWGYAANAFTAFIAAYAAGKMAGPAAGNDVLIGGSLYTINRILTEQFAPVGKVLSLSGVGDAAAASQLGKIRQGYFPLPVQRDKSGNPIIPQAIIDAAVTAAKAQIAPAASKVSGLAGPMAGRLAA